VIIRGRKLASDGAQSCEAGCHPGVTEIGEAAPTCQPCARWRFIGDEGTAPPFPEAAARKRGDGAAEIRAVDKNVWTEVFNRRTNLTAMNFFSHFRCRAARDMDLLRIAELS
jgi:hypothetical protein